MTLIKIFILWVKILILALNIMAKYFLLMCIKIIKKVVWFLNRENKNDRADKASQRKILVYFLCLVKSEIRKKIGLLFFKSSFFFILVRKKVEKHTSLIYWIILLSCMQLSLWFIFHLYFDTSVLPLILILAEDLRTAFYKMCEEDDWADWLNLMIFLLVSFLLYKFACIFFFILLKFLVIKKYIPSLKFVYCLCLRHIFLVPLWIYLISYYNKNKS